MNNWLATTHFSDRITIITYRLRNNGFFPINKLRNLGIRHIRTTHYMVLDIDLMVSSMYYFLCFNVIENLYSELMNLPSSVINGKNHAVILPVFFYLLKPLVAVCHDMDVCISMYVIYIFFQQIYV